MLVGGLQTPFGMGYSRVVRAPPRIKEAIETSDSEPPVWWCGALGSGDMPWTRFMHRNIFGREVFCLCFCSKIGNIQKYELSALSLESWVLQCIMISSTYLVELTVPKMLTTNGGFNANECCMLPTPSVDSVGRCGWVPHPQLQLLVRAQWVLLQHVHGIEFPIWEQDSKQDHFLVLSLFLCFLGSHVGRKKPLCILLLASLCWKGKVSVQSAQIDGRSRVCDVCC